MRGECSQLSGLPVPKLDSRVVPKRTCPGSRSAQARRTAHAAARPWLAYVRLVVQTLLTLRLDGSISWSWTAVMLPLVAWSLAWFAADIYIVSTACHAVVSMVRVFMGMLTVTCERKHTCSGLEGP